MLRRSSWRRHVRRVLCGRLYCDGTRLRHARALRSQLPRPVDQTAIKTLYVFVEISIDPAHLAATIRANFPSEKEDFRAKILGGSQNAAGKRAEVDESAGRAKIQIGDEEQAASSVASAAVPQARTHLALVGTVQFINAIHGFAKRSRNSSIDSLTARSSQDNLRRSIDAHCGLDNRRHGRSHSSSSKVESMEFRRIRRDRSTGQTTQSW